VSILEKLPFRSMTSQNNYSPLPLSAIQKIRVGISQYLMLDNPVKKQVVIVNSLAILTAICCLIISTILWFTAGYIEISGVGVLEACIYFTVPIFNYYKKFNAGLLILFMMQAGSALYFGCLLGANISIEALAVFLVSAALLVIRSVTHKWVTIISILVMTIVLKIIWYENLITPLPLSHLNQKLIYFFATGAVLAMNGTVLYFYERAVKKNRRELEALVAERTAELDRANRFKTIFLNETSHDYRNQLNPLLSICQQLAAQTDNKERSGYVHVPVELIRVLYAASRNMNDIANNVLDLAKIEAGKFSDPQPAPFTLKKWMCTLIDTYQYWAKLKDIQIELQFPRSDLPGRIVSDQALLTLIVNNLLSNAIKFAPKSTTIRVNVFTLGPSLLNISVSDDGEGIADTSFIFGLFNSASPSGEGTGLGLPIAKNLTESLGGNLLVHSKPGHGSTFSVRIPLVEYTREITEEDAGGIYEHYFDAKVMVIEDDPMNQIACRYLLKEMSCTCIIADNAQLAIKLAKENKPDVILLDYYLDLKTKAIDVIPLVKQEPDLRHIPIVLVTGNVNKDELAIAQQQADSCLLKPITGDRLNDILRPYLSTKTTA